MPVRRRRLRPRSAPPRFGRPSGSGTRAGRWTRSGHRTMAAPRYLDQRLRLPLLRAVDAVATHGSLLKASAALGVSQPALTKSLHELEEVLQLRLFNRHSRGVRPTAAGIAFVRSASRV